MSLETVTKAFLLAKNYDCYVSLGGGEPTLHPLFWQIIGIGLGHVCIDVDVRIWLATNGSITNTALQLAKLAKAGILNVDLSLDEWHSPIDQRVVKAFRRDNPYGMPANDLRSIRTITHDNIVAAGRGKKFPSATTVGCVCDNIIVKPNGDVFQCGCEDSPKLGNVHKVGKKIREAMCNSEECWKTVYERKQLEKASEKELAEVAEVA